MNKRILLSALTLLMAVMTGCSSDEVDPMVRVVNQRATKANVQLQTSGGNTININDIDGGSTSPQQTLGAGTVTATAVIKSESVSPTVTFRAEKDHTYTIHIRTGTTPVLQVEDSK